MRDTSSATSSSVISTDAVEGILCKLRNNTKRLSTQQNYISIWRNFNKFLIKLDRKPDNCEDRICLFGAYLVENGLQSSTLKSYYSAIKAVLRDDGYVINDSKVLITSLAKACRLINDKVRTRLPIRKPLFEMLLFEVEQIYSESQPYLEILYKTIIILGYYGMFRIGELTSGSHPVKAKDVHIGHNKDKLLFVLYTSKTHGWESRPQKIKITAVNHKNKGITYFCPFNLARQYLALRGNFFEDNKPFFIFRDRSPVLPQQVRRLMKSSIESVNLNSKNYGFHSLRIGRSSDMALTHRKSIEEANSAGRWRSSTVYKYIRN